MLRVLFVILVILRCNQSKVIGVSTDDIYEIGVGMSDVTGPAAEVSMMGYDNSNQKTGGIHFRQFSRAFIIGDGKSRVVFVSVDAGMLSQLVRLEVIKKLKDKFGDLYTIENVCLSSTHTHSGPAGFFQYFMYNLRTLGFVPQTLDNLVSGITLSIERAHNSIKKGHILYNKGDLFNASINRSPTAYLENPEEERQLYSSDVDTEMYLLKFVDTDGQPLGSINWFAVHPVSMNNTNQLISGDNKGHASLLFEQKMEPDSLLGKTQFVAAFAQSNEGDVSSNIAGPRCIDTGEPCEPKTSTCNGKSDNCIAFGPGKDMFESTKIIGERQFEKAWELFDSASRKLSGPVRFVQQFIDITNVEVEVNSTHKVKTCKGAYGYAAGGGTIDGPVSISHQHFLDPAEESPFWNTIRDLIRKPSKELLECQFPKSILLACGEVDFPVPWLPSIVEIQILRIGGLVILAVPGEFTTMAGRRLRLAVKKVLESNDLQEMDVVIAGLSNVYSHYIATLEEYNYQRFEGGSTMFGPHTLSAYIQEFVNLAEYLKNGTSPPPGPQPPNLKDKLYSLLPPVFYDMAPFMKKFGDVVKEPEQNYLKGSVVETIFVCGNPRNNVTLEDTFLTVEKQLSENPESWKIIATDTNWETKFLWKKIMPLLPISECTVLWEIPSNAEFGNYRIRHFGYYKEFFGDIFRYNGTTRTFSITK